MSKKKGRVAKDRGREYRINSERWRVKVGKEILWM